MFFQSCSRTCWAFGTDGEGFLKVIPAGHIPGGGMSAHVSHLTLPSGLLISWGGDGGLRFDPNTPQTTPCSAPSWVWESTHAEGHTSSLLPQGLRGSRLPPPVLERAWAPVGRLPPWGSQPAAVTAATTHLAHSPAPASAPVGLLHLWGTIGLGGVTLPFVDEVQSGRPVFLSRTGPPYPTSTASTERSLAPA